ncbi:MAG: threonylcarbamoyl-AMP synthase, partial [Clostridia bacterium]|nr:threonylcarbamoyl-AMP synthase [Clostridia bacterium]
MKTEILEAKQAIEKGVGLIKKGELVVFPTETVYGLGADAFNEKAVEKIFTAKDRPQDNPLIVHIASVDQVKDIAKDIPDSFYRVAEKFMPGPISVVLKKGDNIPYIVTAGGGTVAVRMPLNPIARELIALSKPLAAPSANKSKHISPTTAQHVYDDLNGEVALIIDGGSCDVGIESTVLDLTTDT